MRLIPKDYKEYMEISGMSSIARRYFVMNAFDGALTMLGIIIGAYLSGHPDVRVIVGAGVAASVAMGISGVSGAYMTERAERARELKKLERSMLTKLDETVHGGASRFAAVATALVDGISPTLSAMIILSPFLALKLGVVTQTTAFIASLAITGIVLFLLGAYLARISDESLPKYGILMLLIGVVTGIVSMGVAMFFRTV